MTIRQKSLIVNWLNLSNVCVRRSQSMGNVHMYIYSYGLVAGLEALCAVRRKVQTVLFTGFRKKVNVVLGIC